MYNHNYGQFGPSNLSPLFVQSLTCELDSVLETSMPENANWSTGTGSASTGYSYRSSPASPESPLSCTSSHPHHSTKTLFPRSLSSHSLYKTGLQSSLPSLPRTLSNLDIGTIRRVSRTGDLDQGVNTLRHHFHHGGSPLANETTSIIEGMTKPCRYSPEEKKERIERYRGKRSHRNFNKKIQYACRKTLADSRSRVRGRFARNDESEQSENSPDIQWTQLAGEEEDWIHLLESISSNIVP